MRNAMPKKRQAKNDLPRPFKMFWGKGHIVEEARIKTRWHEPRIQLMEFEDGALTLRFCYYSRGSFQRSPLMISSRDLAKLKSAIKGMPRLRKLLKSIT
jgi:hypothetical protein